MRILRLRIDGFGRFADKELGPLDRPVTVFHGPNEAGKSTLLEFVRQVLFGFSRASASTHYPALAGGRYGGSVTLASDGGETVIVQRTAGSHGGTLTLTSAQGEPLPDGGLQRLLGHSEDVFRRVSTFTLDELHSAALLSDSGVNSQIYSAGMGAASLPGALRRLSDDKGKLFRRGGSTQAVYHAAEQLKAIEEKLRDVASNAAEYGSRTAELVEVESAQTELSERRLAVDSELKVLEDLAGAWPDWSELAATRQAMAGLPPTGDFPAGGLSRLEALEESARLARENIGFAERDLEDAQVDAQAPIENEGIGAHTAAIRGIEQGRKAFDDSLHDLPERQTELVNHEHSLRESLQRLGTDWDASRLEEFDMSLVVEDEIRGRQQRIEAARSELVRRESALGQSESLLQEAADAKTKAQQEAEPAATLPGRSTGSARSAAVVAVAALALVVSGAVLGGGALIVGLAAGITLAGVAAYLYVLNRNPAETDTERDRLAREVSSTTKLFEQRGKRTRESREAVEDARRTLDEAQKDWRQWLAERNLRPTLSPEAVADLRGAVELARGRLTNVREWQRRIAAIQKDIDDYVEMVGPLASEFGISSHNADPRTVATAAAGLVDLHAAVSDDVRVRAETHRRLERAQRDVEERGKALAAIDAEISALLQSGGAADADDFRKRADIHAQRTSLQQKQHDLLTSLQRRSGPGEHLERFMQALRETDKQAIDDAIGRAGDARSETNAALDELAKRRAELRARLDSLTSEQESSRLRVERNQLLEQIQGYAREWAVLSIAESLLKEAQSKFERERQPDVIRNSQGFFRRITQGRYQTVFSPLDRPEIHVTESGGDPKQPGELSRGTREQLFLSLRFGYIRDLGERAERLPVLVDEALVNFDPQRGESAAAAFTELAQTNQVLVFTCHPQIVEWFRTAAVRLGEDAPQVIEI